MNFHDTREKFIIAWFLKLSIEATNSVITYSKGKSYAKSNLERNCKLTLKHVAMKSLCNINKTNEGTADYSFVYLIVFWMCHNFYLNNKLNRVCFS